MFTTVYEYAWRFIWCVTGSGDPWAFEMINLNKAEARAFGGCLSTACRQKLVLN